MPNLVQAAGDILADPRTDEYYTVEVCYYAHFGIRSPIEYKDRHLRTGSRRKVIEYMHFGLPRM